MLQDGSWSSTHHICIPGSRMERWVKNKKGGNKACPFPLRTLSKSCTHRFCFHSRIESPNCKEGWKKYTLLQMIMCPDKNWGHYTYEKGENIYWGRTSHSCFSDFVIRGRSQLLNLVFPPSFSCILCGISYV